VFSGFDETVELDSCAIDVNLADVDTFVFSISHGQTTVSVVIRVVVSTVTEDPAEDLEFAGGT
jgi:hypothetical protein